jgi:hypothetical protein
MRKDWYLDRLPSLQENTRVYAVIAALLYSWTILWLFWELPSWLNFLSVGEIVPIFAYGLATAFIESVLVLVGLNLLCLLLPRRWFRESFVPRGFLLVALGLSYVMMITFSLGKEAVYPAGLEYWSLLILVVLLPFSLYAGTVRFIRNLTESIADRLTVFLYLIFPLSLLSLLYVILRNLG